MKQLDLFTKKESDYVPPLPYYFSRFDTSEELDSLLVKLNVVEVGLFYLGERMKKRPISGNYQGLCPFHKEKTPSFYLKPKKNIYVCYGCLERGGSLSLDFSLGRIFNETIQERIEHLCKEREKFKQVLLEAWQREPLPNTHITLLYSVP